MSLAVRLAATARRVEERLRSNDGEGALALRSALDMELRETAARLREQLAPGVG